jgi:urease accessory protein
MTLLALLSPTAVFAHAGHSSDGILTGMLHPLTGMDHLLVMLGVGLLAVLAGGKAKWQIPLTFLAAMLIGALIALSQINIAGIELLIVISVIATGVALFKRIKLSGAIMFSVVAVFAASHGFAHGVEMPVSVEMMKYFAGFIAVTFILQMVGMQVGLMLIKLNLGRLTYRISGALLTIFGGGLLIS